MLSTFIPDSFQFVLAEIKNIRHHYWYLIGVVVSACFAISGTIAMERQNISYDFCHLINKLTG